MVEPEGVAAGAGAGAVRLGWRSASRASWASRETRCAATCVAGEAELQVRPGARGALSAARAGAGGELFDGAAEGNAVVVAELLGERGVEASVRTVQRAVAERRHASCAQPSVATVRFETAPGPPDADRLRREAGRASPAQLVKVYLLVAVLGYSRRHLREGVARASGRTTGARASPRRSATSAACRRTLLVDNARRARRRPRPRDAAR